MVPPNALIYLIIMSESGAMAPGFKNCLGNAGLIEYLEQIAIDRVQFMDPINRESLLYTYEKSKSSLTDRRRRFRSNWICSSWRI